MCWAVSDWRKYFEGYRNSRVGNHTVLLWPLTRPARTSQSYNSLNSHRIIIIFFLKVHWIIVVLVSVLKNGGLLYKKYRNKFFSDLFPKICAQNVHKSAQSVKKLSLCSETVHKALCNKYNRIPHQRKKNVTPFPLHYAIFLGGKGGYFRNMS